MLLATAISASVGCIRRNVPLAAPSGIPNNQRVVIEFERFDVQKGTIWLRLHNWTAWEIRVPVEIASPDIIRSARLHKDGAEVGIRYYLEAYNPRPTMQLTTASGEKVPPDEPAHPPVPEINRVDFLTEWWIPRNQSIIFQIPKEHIARNIVLYVYLRYEWEKLGTETLDGPVHLVYFRGIDLPSEVQARIK
jgi:hypothetical protein